MSRKVIGANWTQIGSMSWLLIVCLLDLVSCNTNQSVIHTTEIKRLIDKLKHRDQEVHVDVIEVLAKVGKDAGPTLTQAFTNQAKLVRGLEGQIEESRAVIRKEEKASIIELKEFLGTWGPNARFDLVKGNMTIYPSAISYANGEEYDFEVIDRIAQPDNYHWEYHLQLTSLDGVQSTIWIGPIRHDEAKNYFLKVRGFGGESHFSRQVKVGENLESNRTAEVLNQLKSRDRRIKQLELENATLKTSLKRRNRDRKSDPILEQLSSELYYRGEPIHPRLVGEFCSWISDTRPITVAVDVVGAYHSNEYSSSINIDKDKLKGTWVSCRSEEDQSYGYRVLGGEGDFTLIEVSDGFGTYQFVLSFEARIGFRNYQGEDVYDQYLIKLEEIR